MGRGMKGRKRLLGRKSEEVSKHKMERGCVYVRACATCVCVEPRE